MFTRKSTLLGVLVATLGLAFGAHADGKRYLVQFKSAAAFAAVTQSFAATQDPMSLLNGAQSNEIHLFSNNVVVHQTLNNLQMMVVESGDALAMESLKNHPAVALVEEEFFHPAPAPIGTQSATARSFSPAPASPSAVAFDIPWGITAVRAPQAWAVTKGAGARVMVLDTGIDIQHPALMSRIEKVQNFTGGTVTDVTDDVGHGSHVSGTILADGLNGGLTGVAPQAKVLMGKVCTKQGCSNIAIASGLNWAVNERVDVVNMSLGGMFMSAGEATALNSAEAAGVMVVAASGNDGQENVSFPGAAPTVLAVGAVDITLAKATFSNWGPELAIMGPGVDVISSVPRGTGRGGAVKVDTGGKGLNDVKSLPFVGSPVSAPSTNDLVYANLGSPSDFAAVNVRGKFALIGRGTLAFKDKVTNAIQAGAAGIIIFNNAPGLLQGTITEDGTEVAVPAAMIEQTVGNAAVAALAAGHPVKASLGVVPSDYASFQGTSMATPHLAGVAALVRAANKSLTPAQVRALLKKTATALSPNDQNQMGAGMVNAEAAVSQAVVLDTDFQQVAN